MIMSLLLSYTFVLVAGIVDAQTEIGSQTVVTVDPTVLSLHEARDRVRKVLQHRQHQQQHQQHPQTLFSPIRVKLLPGTHNVGETPLELGPEDSGLSADAPVIWESADPANPAVVGAPVSITGSYEWKESPPPSLSLPLPSLSLVLSLPHPHHPAPTPLSPIPCALYLYPARMHVL